MHMCVCVCICTYVCRCAHNSSSSVVQFLYNVHSWKRWEWWDIKSGISLPHARPCTVGGVRASVKCCPLAPRRRHANKQKTNMVVESKTPVAKPSCLGGLHTLLYICVASCTVLALCWWCHLHSGALCCINGINKHWSLFFFSLSIVCHLRFFKWCTVVYQFHIIFILHCLVCTEEKIVPGIVFNLFYFLLFVFLLEQSELLCILFVPYNGWHLSCSWGHWISARVLGASSLARMYIL